MLLCRSTTSDFTRVTVPPSGSAAREAQFTAGRGCKVVVLPEHLSTHLKKLEGMIDCDVLVCGDNPEAKKGRTAISRRRRYARLGCRPYRQRRGGRRTYPQCCWASTAGTRLKVQAFALQDYEAHD